MTIGPEDQETRIQLIPTEGLGQVLLAVLGTPTPEGALPYTHTITPSGTHWAKRHPRVLLWWARRLDRLVRPLAEWLDDYLYDGESYDPLPYMTTWSKIDEP